MSSFVLDTFSGRRLDLDDPRPESIVVEDVAAALSKTCRFGAQSLRFHSVAEHAVLVSTLVVDAGHYDLALAALHHDSHEAYLGDIPTPVKRKLRLKEPGADFQILEAALDDAIGSSLGYATALTDEQIAAIKRADRQALIAEASVLLHDGGAGVRDALGAEGLDLAELKPLPAVGDSLSPADAEARFLAVHSQLLAWRPAGSNR